jgi:hypothetical protein
MVQRDIDDNKETMSNVLGFLRSSYEHYNKQLEWQGEDELAWAKR